ncbi:MAG: hypothetical protein AAFW47_03080, partial [Pseudomonadota bacterium]
VAVFCSILAACQSSGPSKLDLAIAANPTLANYPSVGKTYLLFSPFTGYEVRYYETEGRFWSWLSRAEETVHARWFIKRDKNGKFNSLCWERGPERINPIWKKPVPIVNCPWVGEVISKIVSVRDGDIFNITGDKPVPYIRFECDPTNAFKSSPVQINPQRKCDQKRANRTIQSKALGDLSIFSIVNSKKVKRALDPNQTFKTPESLKLPKE